MHPDLSCSLESTPWFIPSASPVISRLASSFICQLISHHSHHPSLLHSFTPGSKPTFSTNPSHLRLLLPTGLPSWQAGPIMLIVLFLVLHFNILFVPCGGLSWLPVSFLLHVKYALSYRIVSYVKRNINIRHKHVTYTREQKISETQKSLKLRFCLLFTGWIAEILCRHLWHIIHHHRP